MRTADRLIDIANSISPSRITLVEYCGDRDAARLALMVTGMKMRKEPLLALRASVEDWDVERIIREVYR